MRDIQIVVHGSPAEDLESIIIIITKTSNGCLIGKLLHRLWSNQIFIGFRLHPDNAFPLYKSS